MSNSKERHDVDVDDAIERITKALKENETDGPPITGAYTQDHIDGLQSLLLEEGEEEVHEETEAREIEFVRLAAVRVPDGNGLYRVVGIGNDSTTHILGNRNTEHEAVERLKLFLPTHHYTVIVDSDRQDFKVYWIVDPVTYHRLERGYEYWTTLAYNPMNLVVNERLFSLLYSDFHEVNEAYHPNEPICEHNDSSPQARIGIRDGIRVRLKPVNQCNVCHIAAMEPVDFDNIFFSFDDYVVWKSRHRE